MAGYLLTAPSGPHSRIDNRVIDRMAELTVYAHGIYSYLVRMQNRTTGACFPSLKKIGKATGLDKKTVIKYLRVLEKEGLVKKKKRHTQTGRRTSNQYDILRFWEIAKQVVRNALTAGKEPPAIPGDPSGPSIDAAVRARAHDTMEQAQFSAAAAAAQTRQEQCSHPAHARRQPANDYAFCGQCYAELPILRE
jgi:predicted transcriptional regulator